MRLSFRYRSITALLMLVLCVLNVVWPPSGLQLNDWLNVGAMWQAPLVLGQAHAGLSVLVLVTVALVASLLLFYPHYKPWMAYFSFTICVLTMLLAFCFGFRLAAAWFLPSLAAWRMGGGRGIFRKAP